jgi:two-component system, cell cycle sensor histidine kinase and response regulator CckA
LAGGIAHDFNNLLTVINGYSTLLMSMVPRTSPAYGCAEQILAAGEKAAGLTGQLLTFSRKQVVRPTDLDLNAVVNNFEKLMRRLIGEHIAVVHQLEPKLLTIRADPSQVDQVLINLLVNARDAMPAGGTITITTANFHNTALLGKMSGDIPCGAYVMLSLADTGCGIDDETKRHLFEPFFTTKEKGQGTGLGLATVYGIVKQFGGHIVVDTVLGKGTTFKIYWPHSEETVLAEKLQTVNPLSGNETILVAEDDDCVRSVIKKTLEAIGYKVLEAGDGVAALAVGENYDGTIHLLLTDVVMPKLDGCELAKRLTKARRNVKVCYITGYVGDSVLGSEILDSGVPFLPKPFSPQALACRVRAALTENKD